MGTVLGNNALTQRRQLRPEEVELERKRSELTDIQTALAERELELADLRCQNAAFESRYLRQVGTLYAELDEWKARICELKAYRDPTTGARQHAEEAREQAQQTHEASHREASRNHEFVSSPELKSLFREVAKRIHPDFARDCADLERRTRLMTGANHAYQTGDAESLRRILEDCYGENGMLGEGIGAELIRIIRQISKAREHLASIERELSALRQSEIARLEEDVKTARDRGRDLLAELADDVQKKIQLARNEYQALVEEVKLP
jgi:predicted  nucleic acid-binding Zn-ribbon protein